LPEYEFHGTRCAHPGVSHYCAQVAQVLQTTSTVRTTRYFTNLPSTAVFFSFLNKSLFSGASSHSHFLFLTSHIFTFHIHIHMPHATAKHDTRYRYHIVVPSVCLNKCNRNRYMYIHSCVYTFSTTNHVQLSCALNTHAPPRINFYAQKIDRRWPTLCQNYDEIPTEGAILHTLRRNSNTTVHVGKQVPYLRQPIPWGFLN
jgi:hypothetical protein